MELRSANGADRGAIERLLEENGLPVPGAADRPVTLFVAEEGREIVGCAGYERYDARALLRSVAVTAGRRGAGFGRELVESIVVRIAPLGVREVFLVTLDAADFFSRLGFRAVAREAVPEAIHASREWELHACAGGTWMLRELP